MTDVTGASQVFATFIGRRLARPLLLWTGGGALQRKIH
jgi:hypothetical protein